MQHADLNVTVEALEGLQLYRRLVSPMKLYSEPTKSLKVEQVRPTAKWRMGTMNSNSVLVLRILQFIRCDMFTT